MSTPNNEGVGPGKVNLPGIYPHRRQHRARHPRFDVERVHPDSDPSVSGLFERFRLSQRPGSAPDERKPPEVSTSPGPVSLPDHLPPISQPKFPKLTARLLAEHAQIEGNAPSGLARKIARMVEKDLTLSRADKIKDFKIIRDKVRKLQGVSGSPVDSAIGNPEKLLLRFGEIQKAGASLDSLTELYKGLPKHKITKVTKKQLMIRNMGELDRAYTILHRHVMRVKEGHVPHLSDDLYANLRKVYVDIQNFFR